MIIMMTKGEQMNSITKTQKQAVDQFVECVRDNKMLCEAIIQHLDDHHEVNPEHIHFGHVGTARHVSELLLQVCEFMGIKVEN
jgi:hypothetical protein